jgi:hypothetical protein
MLRNWGHIHKAFFLRKFKLANKLDGLSLPDLSSLVLPLRRGAYPSIEVHERCFTWVGCNLTDKHSTKLERLNSDKHSSIFGPIVSYEEN